MLCISVCVKAAGCSREEKDGKKRDKTPREKRKREHVQAAGREGGRRTG